jgi:DUF971 family protein
MVSSPSKSIVPKEMRWLPGGSLEIVWADLTQSIHSAPWLRSICPCAECQGTHGTPPKAFKILSQAQVQDVSSQTEIVAVKPVGHYAICFTWGDGHSDGIYSWSFLRDNIERTDASKPKEPRTD